MEPGYLVEFFEEKRILCAVVQELKGERLHVLTQTNRELTIPRKRVLHACPTRLSPQLPRRQWLDFLEKAARQREALKAAINLEEVWELLAQENQPLSAADMADLWFGEASPDRVAAMTRALTEARFFFKHKDDMWIPNSPEVVEQLRDKVRREEEVQQELAEAGAWLKAAWDKGKIDDPEWRRHLVEVLKQMAILGPEAPEYARGKAYLEKARLTADDAPFRLLCRLQVFHEDENLDLYRLEMPREFSPEARSAALRLSSEEFPDPLARQRLDLTHLQVITIDGERTRDFDDALSLEAVPEGWRLGIHISDVSSLVLPGTTLDQEAMARGSSIYFPEERLGMLPEEISEDTLSLLAQEERRALSFLVDLSPDAEVLDWRIRPSLIKVHRRLTYHEVDGLLPHDELLANLSRLTGKIKDRRLSQGGYELKLPEVWVIFPQGQIQVVVEDQETLSHQLVSEAMVLGNYLSARFLAEQGVPAIFRSQAEPREPIKPREGKDLVELWQDRRRLSRVVTDLAPHPHWGLGLPCYTFATSPIRRYLDLVIHRQILSAISDSLPFYSPADLEKILMVMEPAMRRAGQLKTRRLRYWLLKHLMGKMGQKMEALVLDEINRRYRLLLPDILLEVPFTAPASLRLRPGDTVQLRLDRVNPREDQVKVSLA